MKLERSLSDDFVIESKRRIRDLLVNDVDIATLLRDDIPQEELDKIDRIDNPFIDFGYIMPYIFVPTAQTRDTCYVCYKLNGEAINPYNPYKLTHYLTFVVFCSPKKQDTDMMANRVDAIAYCIKDIFEWGSPLGMSWSVYEDVESVLTAGYIARTLTFRAADVNIQTHKNSTAGRSGLTYPNYDKHINPAIKRTRHGTTEYDDSEL